MDVSTMDEIAATITNSTETHVSAAAMNEMLPITNSATHKFFFSVALYQSIMSEWFRLGQNVYAKPCGIGFVLVFAASMETVPLVWI
jgi:hypothetical protein